MQKLRLTLFVSLLLFLSPGAHATSTPSAGNNTHPFQDDLRQIDCRMSELEQLEQLLETQPTTLTALNQANHPLAKHLLPESDIAGSLFGAAAPDHERLMDIPGFLWGFCCSFVGVFLMYLSIDDPVAKKKEGVQAIIGCAVGTVIWLGLYIWFVFTASYY